MLIHLKNSFVGEAMEGVTDYAEMHKHDHHSVFNGEPAHKTMLELNRKPIKKNLELWIEEGILSRTSTIADLLTILENSNAGHEPHSSKQRF